MERTSREGGTEGGRNESKERGLNLSRDEI